MTGTGGASAARGAGTAGTGSVNEAPAMTVVRHGERGLVVSAKAVHLALGVGRDFSSWLKSRINRYGFEAGIDYWEMGDFDSPERVNQDATTELNPVRGKTPEGVDGFSPVWGKTSGGFTPKRGKTSEAVNLGGRPELDYWLSLDMAKELAMLERSDAGRAARKYFLECERKLKEVLTQGQPRLEPEMQLTAQEIEVFNRFNAWLTENGDLTTMKLNDELSYIVLPALLKKVLEDGGLNEQAIGKLDLRGYAPLYAYLTVSARGVVTPGDVAKRMRTKKMPQGLVASISENTWHLIAGWDSARLQLGAIRALASWGVR